MTMYILYRICIVALKLKQISLSKQTFYVIMCAKKCILSPPLKLFSLTVKKTIILKILQIKVFRCAVGWSVKFFFDWTEQVK